jgi:hypothetical protein
MGSSGEPEHSARNPLFADIAQSLRIRLLGYDNAHGVRPPGKAKYTGRRVTYDHRHRHTRCCGVPYEFTSADQLLKDFFDEVDRVLKQAGS